MIFSTSSCPSLIALSSLPASIPNAGLFPATLLAEDLASHSSYRCSAFFFFISLQLHGHLHVLLMVPSPSPPPRGMDPTNWRNPGGKGLLFPYFHGAPFPQKRARCWHRAGSCVSHPLAVPALWAQGRDLAPCTALPEPAAPRGKLLLPGLAPASPKIQLNGTGFSTNLSGRIQPRRAGVRAPPAARVPRSGNSLPVTSPV